MLNSPLNRHVAWDNRAHVTCSKDNNQLHTHYKEFFDKKKGLS